MLVSKSDLIAILGVANVTLDRWINHHGCPCVTRPQSQPGQDKTTKGARKGRGEWQFDTVAVIQWFVAWKAEEIAKEKLESGTAAAISPAFDNFTPGNLPPDIRKLIAQADLEEVKLARELSKLVSVEDFEAGMASLISMAKSKLRGIGAQLGLELSNLNTPHDCATLVQRTIEQVLSEMSQTRVEMEGGRVQFTTLEEEEFEKLVEEEAALDGDGTDASGAGRPSEPVDGSSVLDSFLNSSRSPNSRNPKSNSKVKR